MRKKLLSAILIITGLVSFAPQSHAEDLSQRLKGNILLQVEAHGEAWYVNPADSMRYYMKDGSVAYQMMRSLGLGITDADLAKIPSVSSTSDMNSSSSICLSNTTANRLKGKLLLQVQQHGEAWYIYPKTCRSIYMKDGQSAYEIMRFLGLGITTSNLAQIAIKDGYGLYDVKTEYIVNSGSLDLFPINLVNNLNWEIDIRIIKSDWGSASGSTFFRVTKTISKYNSTEQISVKSMSVDSKTGLEYELSGDYNKYTGYLSDGYLKLTQTTYTYPNLYIGRHTDVYQIPIVIASKEVDGSEQSYWDDSSSVSGTGSSKGTTKYSITIKAKNKDEVTCTVKGIIYSPYNLYYTQDSKKFDEQIGFRCFSSEQEALDAGFKKALDN